MTYCILIINEVVDIHHLKLHHLTPPHSSSLLLTPPHSSSLLLTPPHSSSLLLTPPPQKSGSIGLYITTLQLFFLQKTQKMPTIRWQSALCLREKCCLDCILYDCNYCPPPQEKHFRCPFHSKSAPRNRGPPIFCCFLLPCFERVLFNCRELVLLRDRSLITGEGGGGGAG
jgi:hypothetical protein